MFFFCCCFSCSIPHYVARNVHCKCRFCFVCPRVCCGGGFNVCVPYVFCSPAVVVVRGAGSPPPAASPEEPAERAARKSPHAAQHEQHEARPHSQVSGVRARPPSCSRDFTEGICQKLGRTCHLKMHRKKLTYAAFPLRLYHTI